MMTEAAGPAARATAAKTASADASETSPASSVSITFAALDAGSRACVHSQRFVYAHVMSIRTMSTHAALQTYALAAAVHSVVYLVSDTRFRTCMPLASCATDG